MGYEAPIQNPPDPDRALKDAIVAALEGGLYDRAGKLLDVLRVTRAAEVVSIKRPRERSE